MDNRVEITTHDDDPVVEDGRWSHATVDARTSSGLRHILRRARGWVCDIRGVALDDQSAKLHVPLLAKPDRRSPSRRVPAGELIVRRVEEFLFEGASSRSRWCELDALAYDPATGRLTIAADGRNVFDLTVEALDVTLRIRPQSRPRS